ncbi:DUF2840 domain-containing protein [Hyphococcus sp.]|uniref:DUF2840 domain-containing protein n=2 Tax=Hyphococcus sp. TaxID=2038636 RepID=UPI0035C66448
MTGTDSHSSPITAFRAHGNAALVQRRCSDAPENCAYRQALASTGIPTRVELFSLSRRADYRLRFGAPDMVHRLDAARALAYFRHGRLFGYVRWRALENGVNDWRFAIFDARAPARTAGPVDGVHTGGAALLSLAGAAKVRRTLLQIDSLELAGFDPGAVSPGYFRDLHDRIETAEPVRAYSREEHAAFMTKTRCG